MKNNLFEAAIKYGILSFEDVRQQVTMKQNIRKEILRNHKYKIWKSKNGKWYTYVYDESKPNNRRLVKKSSLEAIEDYICGTGDDRRNLAPETFRECYYTWRKIHDKTLCGNSVIRYDTDYQRFIFGTYFENEKIAKLKKSDIEAFIFSRIKELKLCQSAAKKLYEYIHATMLYALENEWIYKDPMQFMKVKDFSSRCYVSERQKKEQTISELDAKKILEQIRLDRETKPNYIPSYAVEFAMLTAMRVGEIAGLKWSDIKGDAILVSCSEKFDRKSGKYYIDDTKNRSQRVIPITMQMDELLSSVKGQVGNSEFIFGGIHADTISSCIENKCKQANVQYHGIHACRKTINSRMKKNGVGGVVSSSILGNTEEVNSKHYSFDLSSMDEKRTILEKASMI